MKPVTEFLIRRWALPAERGALVEKLLEGCDQGATALLLDSADAKADWGKALVSHEEVTAAAPSPLVLLRDKGRYFLQTWAHYQAECFIAASLRQRVLGSLRKKRELNEAELARLESLFLSTTEKSPYRGHFDAAALALRHDFALITGGPGTGKTSTLARILASLLSAGSETGAPLRVTLAAPTGKAAERMREAVEKAIDPILPTFPNLKDDLLRAAASSCTLHRLLGYNPSSGNCAYNAGNPLPLDVLVIDEASMIDVMLWRALLDATPLNTRIIVLGDPCQLESVAAGRVLADLVEASRENSVLEHSWAHLTKSFRFEKRPDIAKLAELIAHEDAEGVEHLLGMLKGEFAPGGVAWLGENDSAPSWDELPAAVRKALLEVAQAPDPTTALKALSQVCLLSAHRENTSGALGLSAMIERHLLRLGLGVDGHPHNQPIIINQNDSETGLNNGSVGIVCHDAERGRLAWFPSADRGAPPRSFALGKLPDHSPAWALTIHRSQGSEYDQVYVLLPRSDSPLATRELIYTAITRARENVYLAGPLETIRRAVTSEQLRTTCLARHLRD